MNINFTLPQLNYIVFELVRINIEDYLKGEYRAVAEDTIYLATMPQQFQYRLISRDAITQTDKKVFLNRYDYQPEKCTISGYFGVEPRLMAGTLINGWSRLEQFQRDIIKKSKVTNIQANEQKFVYGINYYDFWWHKFGNLNIDQWSLRGNSRENTQMPRYNLDFTLLGDLIDAEGNDLLLQGMKKLFGEGGITDNLIGLINSSLNSIGFTQYLAIGTESIKTAVSLVQEAESFIAGYSRSYQNIMN